jgi:hypothetical protein
LLILCLADCTKKEKPEEAAQPAAGEPPPRADFLKKSGNFCRQRSFPTTGKRNLPSSFSLWVNGICRTPKYSSGLRTIIYALSFGAEKERLRYYGG